MPEQREPTAEALKLKHAIFQAQSKGSDFSSVILVKLLNPPRTCAFTAILWTKLMCLAYLNVAKLKLKINISATAHALILDLGPLKLLFAFLTHCNLNLYLREQWEKSICVLTKAQCHFSVGLAFEFRLHFLAFISIDLIFQPVWYYSIDPPPFEATIPDPFFQFMEFLDMVASELSEILDSNCSKGTKLAIKAVQDLKSFHGAGAYTSIELFGMADDLWKLIHPVIHDGILALTQDHDLSTFQATLADIEQDISVAYAHGDQSCALYDVFEPNCICAALERMEVNLGHLIFMQPEWESLSGMKTLLSLDDPLTAMFRTS
ncbi:hypothetical protein BT96DRAFT_936331 [Gymnopus androsaceus JB14]|uniref:Uncharacterized protein n=1 Tax=Gymnopus androsaceus JB14 TaxID=1447944 RepID=A0A6A4HY41_9AGAR|nr:hypothetical protein BT96DRAFT_936331 [Gymnopus androsaceus JB14]